MTDKIQQLHDNLPGMYQTEVNPNWKALIEAIGTSDQVTADLIEQIRKQFFIPTASRPYLDRLGSQHSIQRPKLVGMSDASFRQFIPVMSYSPKQVKIVFDKLLDIFFLKEATTSFVESAAREPYLLEDGWTLTYYVDNTFSERIEFTKADFKDMSRATAVEVAATINRQAQYSYAIPMVDRNSRSSFIRLFTNTVGSKGSIQILGRLANIALQLDDFNITSGYGLTTQWTVTKVGELTTFTYVGGGDPVLSSVEVGDIALINLPGNAGAYLVTAVDNSLQNFSIRNSASVTGNYTESPVVTFVPWDITSTYGIGDMASHEGQVFISLTGGNTGNLPVGDLVNWQLKSNEVIRFMKDYTAHVYQSKQRAITWEVSPGQIDIEMPASPPVVRRFRKGAAHINGTTATMIQRIDATTLSINETLPSFTTWNTTATYTKGDVVLYNDIYYYSLLSNNINNLPDTAVDYWIIDYIGFPVDGGRFALQQNEEIWNEISNTEIAINKFNTRLSSDQPVYNYTSRVGNILYGITPDLPSLAAVYKVNATTASRVNNVLIINSATPHGFTENDIAILDGAVETPGIISLNGAWKISSITNAYTIVCESAGDDNTATGGTVRVERPGLSDTGSLIILQTATLKPRTVGPYLWDTNAPYVLSSKKTALEQLITAGSAQRNILVDPNTIDNAEGLLVFGFGTAKEEGPVRYFFKPSSNTIAIDPSYVFKFQHNIGESIIQINRQGGIQFSTTGKERAPYVTDPGAAREALKELMQQVKSVGIFLNFIIRYPQLYYATLDVYNSGIDPG